VNRPIEMTFTTSVSAERESVWRSVSTMPGVNDELHPLVHMTSPKEHRALPHEVTPGQVLFRSWIMLFGVLPVDRHALALESVDVGSGLVEASSSWLQRQWCHERTLADLPVGGCSVRDRLVIEPRLHLAQPVVALVVKLLFEHRHRRLAKRFGRDPQPVCPATG